MQKNIQMLTTQLTKNKENEERVMRMLEEEKDKIRTLGIEKADLV